MRIKKERPPWVRLSFFIRVMPFADVKFILNIERVSAKGTRGSLRLPRVKGWGTRAWRSESRGWAGRARAGRKGSYARESSFG